MKLWFEDANGNQQIIKNNVATWTEVDQAINEFIDQCNTNKINARKRYYGDAYDPTKDHLFIRYYTRVWEQDGKTKIDVGSHTEFFIWEGEYGSNRE